MNCSLAGRRSAEILLVAFSVFLFASPAAAADWPRFRGPQSSGISSDTGIPVEWSDTKHLRWKLDLPGAGFSSPIVVGDKVLVTCYSGSGGDLKRHLVCVDRRQGKVLWSKVVPAIVPERGGPAFGTSHGYASHTPVSDGQRVYVLFGNTGVLAFDLDGKQLWQKSVGHENAAMFGSAASPILYKDRLIVTAAAESTTFYALDKKTGEEVWKIKAESLSRCYSTPLIVTNGDGEDELLISVAYEIWSMNPDTGKLKWYAETKVDMNACPSLIAREGVAYAIGGRSGGRTAVRIGGKDDVTKANVLWSMSGGSYVSSPILHKGRLYWVNDRGIAFCIDAASGKELGSKRLGGQFYASVVLIEEKLYALSRFGGTYVLEATPELTQVAHNELSDQSDFSGSPAVADGQLILRSDKRLYCIEAE
ncbi:MAG: PQQ-binding-like beta-propeller repeat protein [Planctomycetes bacterium]|nr:PQQ-binding-like beta-propeller repeat protein [Planctomycetota bacterium]